MADQVRSWRAAYDDAVAKLNQSGRDALAALDSAHQAHGVERARLLLEWSRAAAALVDLRAEHERRVTELQAANRMLFRHSFHPAGYEERCARCVIVAALAAEGVKPCTCTDRA